MVKRKSLKRRFKLFRHLLPGKIFRHLYLVTSVIAAFLLFSVSQSTASSPRSPARKLFSAPVSPFPQVTAKYIFILDRNSGRVLYQKNAGERIYPASTTKMMTALVAYSKFPLDFPISVPQSFNDGQNIHLKPGEQLTVSSLLYALLVQSANDSAEVLAAAYPLSGRSGFVEDMNQLAAQYHLTDTHFLNPTGLDQIGHYSTAADLTRLANHLLDNPYLAGIVSTQNAVISSADYSDYYSLSNVNRLLGKIPGVMGIKTGFTDLAGESLITYINQNDHQVIISLLGSNDRFADTEKIIDWLPE